MTRLLFLDAIKAFAILLVIFVHMQNFLASILVANYAFFEVLKFIALACFTFASGYAIHANNRDLMGEREVRHFYKKRFVRIYPLYLAALIVFFLCFQVFGLFPPIHYSAAGWAANVLCLQVLLSPAFVEPVFTLWFIGFIVMMYAFYPLLSQGPVKKKILFTAGIFGILAVIHVLFDLVDYRFFLYYFFFIFGMIAADAGYRAPRVERSLNRHGKLLVPAITVLAYASYCIFLFHMPIFSVTGRFISDAGVSGALQNAVVLFLVIPAILFVGYYLQKMYDASVRYARTRRSSQDGSR